MNCSIRPKMESGGLSGAEAKMDFISPTVFIFDASREINSVLQLWIERSREYLRTRQILTFKHVCRTEVVPRSVADGVATRFSVAGTNTVVNRLQSSSSTPLRWQAWLVIILYCFPDQYHYIVSSVFYVATCRIMDRGRPWRRGNDPCRRVGGTQKRDWSIDRGLVSQLEDFQ